MSIQIQVRLAEPFWRTVGKREIELQVKEGATLKTLLNTLNDSYPNLTNEFKEAQPVLFICEEEANIETKLNDGDKVHIVWPLAGG